MNMKKSYYYALAAILLAADQVAKKIALVVLQNQTIEVLPFLQFALAFNKGAAFGFLHAAQGWGGFFLAGIAALVSVFLVVWIWRARDAFSGCAFALILSGALGNLMDRLQYGHVVDFILLHAVLFGENWRFPTFNFADACITIGAAVFIFYEVFVKNKNA